MHAACAELRSQPRGRSGKGFERTSQARTRLAFRISGNAHLQTTRLIIRTSQKLRSVTSGTVRVVASSNQLSCTCLQRHVPTSPPL